MSKARAAYQPVVQPDINSDKLEMDIPACVKEMQILAGNGEIQSLLAAAGCAAIKELHAEILAFNLKHNREMNIKLMGWQNFNQRNKLLSQLLMSVYLVNTLYKPTMTQTELDDYNALCNQIASDVDELANDRYRNDSIKSDRLKAALMVVASVIALALGILIALALTKVLALPILVGISFIDVTNAIGLIAASPILTAVGLYGLFNRDAAVEGPRAILATLNNNLPKVDEVSQSAPSQTLNS